MGYQSPEKQGSYEHSWEYNSPFSWPVALSQRAKWSLEIPAMLLDVPRWELERTAAAEPRNHGLFFNQELFQVLRILSQRDPRRGGGIFLGDLRDLSRNSVYELSRQCFTNRFVAGGLMNPIPLAIPMAKEISPESFYCLIHLPVSQCGHSMCYSMLSHIKQIVLEYIAITVSVLIYNILVYMLISHISITYQVTDVFSVANQHTTDILQHNLHAKQHEDLILIHTLELCHLKVGNGTWTTIKSSGCSNIHRIS